MEESKEFLTMKESREGLKQLANDVRTFAKKPHSVRFGFIDVLKILFVCAVAGAGVGLGLKIIEWTIGGF